MSTQRIIPVLPLPVIITKGELARYLGCHISTLWRTYLTKATLAEWGYDYDTQLKYHHRFPVALTARIFSHFGITAEGWHSRVSLHITKHRSAA